MTSRRHTESALAALLYLAYALFLTWPLVLHPVHLLSGTGVSGDLGGSVAQNATLIKSHIFPFLPARIHALDAPQGLVQPWVENWASFPSNALLYLLSLVFGAVAGSNVFLWGSYVLTGLSMFWLVRRLYGSFGAALLAGFAFAYFPWAIDKLNGHYQYMDGFALVVGVWRLLELIQKPSARNALLAGAAVAFGMWWTPYFILIDGVGYVVMLVIFIVLDAGRAVGRRALGLAALTVIPIAIVFGGLAVLTRFAGGVATGTVRAQSVDELYTYSARTLEWVLPDHHNFLLGGATGPYLTTHLHGSNFSESSLYLGISVIILALGGLGLAVATAIRKRTGAIDDPRFVAAVSGILIAFVAAVFSLPPTVNLLGAPITMPSGFIFKVTSTWRVYSRFVELVELGLCIPLGWAAAVLIQRRTAVRSVAVFAALAAILVVDLWARPSVRTVSTSPPAPYVWLRDHPGGIVADYPIEPAVFPDYTDLYWEPVDHHPLFQGYAADTETESLKLDVSALANPRTASYLAAMGVRYIVVRPGQPGATAATIRRQHYIVRFSSPQGSVWQVGARPARILVQSLDGFYAPEGSPTASYRWMVAPTATLGVVARGCPSCSGTLHFVTASNVQPRVLTVRLGATGRVLTRVTIPARRAVPVTVPGITLHSGMARLSLSTSPGPTNAPPGDPRQLSVSVGVPTFTLNGR